MERTTKLWVLENRRKSGNWLSRLETVENYATRGECAGQLDSENKTQENKESLRNCECQELCTMEASRAENRAVWESV